MKYELHIGDKLSIRQLSEYLGGHVLSPCNVFQSNDGDLLCISIEKKYHPLSPRELWIEEGYGKELDLFTRSGKALPLFLKDSSTGSWRFMGKFTAHIDANRQEDKLRELNTAPPRKRIMAVLSLRLAQPELEQKAA